MIRVGIVGCGNIGKIHAEVLKSMEGVQIEAFADENLINASKYAEQYGHRKRVLIRPFHKCLMKKRLM